MAEVVVGGLESFVSTGRGEGGTGGVAMVLSVALNL
jgi:hypothetical protein